MLNIFYHRSTAIVFRIVLFDLYGNCGNFCFLKKIFSKSSYIYVFLIQKPVTSITQKWLVVERSLTPQWIIFLMFYRLIYKINSHLNELILAWSALLLKQTGIVIQFLSLLMVIELLWNRKERWSTVGHALFEPVRVSANQGFLRWSKI